MDKQQYIDQLFAQAKQGPVMQSFSETKDRFKASVNHPAVNKTKTKQVFTKKWILMLTTVSTISLSMFLLWNGETTNKTTPKTHKVKVDQTFSHNTAIPDQRQKRLNQEAKTIKKPVPFLAALQEMVTELPLTEESPESEILPNDGKSQKPAPKFLDEPYKFPVLTEEEIAITKKKKKSMLKALIKHDKDAYAYIPSGTFDYNGNQVSVQAFYMGVGEVTNFEYRTFLFDLLIQGRKDEFLKAKPDQSKWNTYPMYSLKYLQDNYFSDKKYNNYPVVNISREGAELYCKWLSEEVRKSVGVDNEEKYNDVRLPLRVEWVKAASNEGKQLPFPWDGPYIRNSDGMHLGNFVWGKTDSITAKAYLIDTSAIHDVLAPSKSFWPNALGLYNMSGNAAEMVYEGTDKAAPGTAGGGWRNWPQEVAIYGPDTYKGVIDPKPTIGFRVVSTYLVQKK